MGKCLPDGAAWASSRCGLFGGRSHGALVLLAQCVDGGVVIRGCGSTAVRRRMAADWLNPGTERARLRSTTQINKEQITTAIYKNEQVLMSSTLQSGRLISEIAK